MVGSLLNTEASNSCAICLDPLPSPDNSINAPDPCSKLQPCGHQYHRSCFGEFAYHAGNDARCPLCRSKPINLDELQLTRGEADQLGLLQAARPNYRMRAIRVIVRDNFPLVAMMCVYVLGQRLLDPNVNITDKVGKALIIAALPLVKRAVSDYRLYQRAQEMDMQVRELQRHRMQA